MQIEKIRILINIYRLSRCCANTNKKKKKKHFLDMWCVLHLYTKHALKYTCCNESSVKQKIFVTQECHHFILKPPIQNTILCTVSFCEFQIVRLTLLPSQILSSTYAPSTLGCLNKEVRCYFSARF